MKTNKTYNDIIIEINEIEKEQIKYLKRIIIFTIISLISSIITLIIYII